MRLSIYLSICLSIYLPSYPLIDLSSCLSIYLSICRYASGRIVLNICIEQANRPSPNGPIPSRTLRPVKGLTQEGHEEQNGHLDRHGQTSEMGVSHLTGVAFLEFVLYPLFVAFEGKPTRKPRKFEGSPKNRHTQLGTLPFSDERVGKEALKRLATSDY